jgi:hypothetical protein
MLMSWSEVIMQPRCRAFDSSLNPLTKVIDQQTGIMPLGWSHCTRSCLFSMMFLNTNFAPSDLNYGIYAMDFNPEKLKFLAKEKIERIPCHGMVYAKGYSREGSRILCWSLMKNPEGVFARIIR